MGLQFQIVLTKISRNTNIQEIRERVKNYIQEGKVDNSTPYKNTEAKY